MALLTLAAIAIALVGATLASAAGDGAVTGVQVGCETITFTSTKDLSNVIVKYEDGTYAKFDNLSGPSYDIPNN
ncbi:MAG TPA: hypothetical protein VFU90_16140, partial [Candidatus Tumulicola sp.]|nr:hypothetical protein [Candidatus Tumulicola sp.]